ncbi:MAG: RluA family pseudouridine synthase [Clostridia bacterium]|nr:RluA family pseudouridine synthase [Clostridia bacterium]
MELIKVKNSGRLDAALAAESGVSRAMAQKLIDSGRCFVNGRPAKKSMRVDPGDEISADFPEPENDDVSPEEISLDIVYEDGDLLVINKPKGMVVHPSAGHKGGTLVSALLYHCGDSLSGVGGVKRPGIVHRIDKDTSGLLLVAKNDAAHLSLSKQIAAHTAARVYHTVVLGDVAEDGTVDAPIGRSRRDRKKQAVVEDGKPAVTHYEVLSRLGGLTYLKCRLETGRTHQIRVHMAYIGHPVLGDGVYGSLSSPQNKKYRFLEGQCLVAKEIGFVHPRTGERMHFEIPLPDYFEKIIGK